MSESSNNPDGKPKKHSILIDTSSTKEQNIYKKLPSSSTSGRRLSFVSTIQTSKAGSMARRSIVITTEPKMEKGPLPSSKPLVQVFDEHGKDVTPRPLYRPELNVAHRQSKILSVHDFAGVTQPDFLSSLSMQQTSVASISLAGPFSRTYGSGSVTKSSASSESMAEEIVEPGSRRDTIASFTDVQVRRDEILEQLTKHDLEKTVNIFLTETETIWLFNMPTAMISTEAEEAEYVRKRNIAYMELCKNRVGNDQYANRTMQTLNGAPKTKEVQCDKIIMADKEIMATTWDLFDSFNALEEATAEPISEVQTISAGKSAVVKERDKAIPLGSVEAESFTSSSIIDLESVILSRIQEEIEDHSEIILKSDKFHQDLFYMERVLMENIFQSKLAAYRKLPILIEPDAKSEYSESEFDNVSVKEEKEEEEEAEEDHPSIKSSLLLELSERQEEQAPPFMEALWSYGCNLTRGNNVSCMAWNKLNPDLLAVGYGQFRFQEQKKGLACCWSLKNPMWPERIYNCVHGVTALDFSTANPNLLAVGLFNGTIEVYNVQSRNQTSVLDNSESHDKHLGPVWQLKWVEQDRGTSGEDKGEILVSISADGRVTKWFVRKGLSCTDLMKLKRTTSEKKKAGTERKSEALISRQAPGLSFDFHGHSIERVCVCVCVCESVKGKTALWATQPQFSQVCVAVREASAMPGAVLVVAATGVALVVAFLLLLYLVSPLSHPKPLALSGAHVVVTGGSSGIGKNIAIECVKQGAFVTLIARNEKRLLEAKKEIETFSVNDKQVVHSISLDVSKDYANVEKLLKQAQEKLGPVDMLVNCAGTSITGKFEDIDMYRFEQLMAINYLGSVYPTRAVVGKMKERRMGRIVFVSSQAGQVGVYGYSAYSATKYALRGLAESLHMEVKPYNICVTIAYPPDTDTPGFAEECQNKVLETKLISEASSVCQPDYVAKIIVKDAVQGKFASSVGTDGHILTILTNGMAPVSSIAEILESVMFLGLFRLVSLYFIAGFDSIVRRCMIEKEKSEKTD